VTELRYDGRVALITGGGRGLGRAYALLLAARGCKVVVNDPGSAIKGEGVDAGPAEQVVAEIKAAGGEAIANTDSVATPEGAAAMVQAAIDQWGRLDILIHNAGNVRYGSLQDISIDDFKAVVDVHFMGGFYVVRAAFPLMADAGYGRVILTSSIGGIYGNQNCVNYGMSKAGLLGLNNIVALEGEALDIKCNAIAPGAVTRMADGLDTSKYPPMGPELVAPLVAWLAHEKCSVSGETYASVSGRNARVFFAETPGAYQPEWTIEDVDARIADIRAKPEVLDFGLHGHLGHLGYSFEMVGKGK